MSGCGLSVAADWPKSTSPELDFKRLAYDQANSPPYDNMRLKETEIFEAGPSKPLLYLRLLRQTREIDPSLSR